MAKARFGHPCMRRPTLRPAPAQSTPCSACLSFTGGHAALVHASLGCSKLRLGAAACLVAAARPGWTARAACAAATGGSSVHGSPGPQGHAAHTATAVYRVGLFALSRPCALLALSLLGHAACSRNASKSGSSRKSGSGSERPLPLSSKRRFTRHAAAGAGEAAPPVPQPRLRQTAPPEQA